jgi:hypothetical protein
MIASQSAPAVVLATGVTLSGSVVVSGLAGAIAGGTALWSLRALWRGSSRIQGDLLRPFAAVTVVIAAGAVGLPVAAGPLRAGVISVVPLLTFLVAFVPWNVFALRYAGRGDLLTRWRVLTVGSLVAVLIVVYVAVAAGLLQPSQESYSSVLLVPRRCCSDSSRSRSSRVAWSSPRRTATAASRSPVGPPWCFPSRFW